MSDIFQQLNQEQIEAVKHTEGPLLVLAGAGSGKTRVITFRILYLLQNKNIPASYILGVTFTNKAANEMKERIYKLAGKKVKGLVLSTFHSFGVRILRNHIHHLGYKNNFTIYDETDRKNIILNIMSEMNISSMELKPNIILKSISMAKNSNQFARYFDFIEDERLKEILKNIYKRYGEMLKNYNAVDFDDLIILPIKIFKTQKDVRKKYKEQYQYILVDEYQDTNNVQYQFLNLILNKNKNICVVGDDDQAIYGFRGSKVEHILKFEKDFPGTKIITLTRNYRSTKNILSAAGHVIQNNKSRHKKSIKSIKDSGDRILILSKMDEKEEAESIASKIQEYRLRFKYPWSSMAILFRTNFQSRPFEEAFRTRDIPYNIIGGIQFYDRKEIKDILSYLKLIANEKDENSLLRVINCPRRGIGDKTIMHLNQYSSDKNITLYEALSQVIYIDTIKNTARAAIMDFVGVIEKFKKQFFHTKRPMYKIAYDLILEIGYEDALKDEIKELYIVKRKMANISELISSIRIFEEESRETGEKPSLYNYLNKISLLTRDEEEKEDDLKAGKVSMMTFHLSKGLEFKVVFLVGIEEGLLPHLRTLEEGGSLEEERRLFYVGMTRAKERLIISYALQRKKFGVIKEKAPSRFIRELPENCIIQSDTEQFADKENIAEKALRELKHLINN